MKVECPTWYWGVWFALGAMSPACGSVIPALLFSIAEAAISFASNISFGMSAPGAATMSMSFLMAAMVGVYFLEHGRVVRLRVQRERERKRIEQQRETLETMRYLHDEIAGDITYAMQLNRLNSGDFGMESVEHDRLSEIERVLSRALRSIRAAAEDPRRREVRGKHARDESAEYARHRLFLLLREQQDRLARLGFRGTATVVGTPATLPARTVASITTVSDEMLNNIVAHGSPGPYSFDVIIPVNGDIRIVSINQTDENEHSHDDNGLGLRLIRRTVDDLHGETTVSSQDGEWMISVRIPASRETLLAGQSRVHAANGDEYTFV